MLSEKSYSQLQVPVPGAERGVSTPADTDAMEEMLMTLAGSRESESLASNSVKLHIRSDM